MDVYEQYPEIASFLDDSEDYEISASEFSADDQRWLLVTQRGQEDGGQLLFRITRAGLMPAAIDTAINLNPISRGDEAETTRSPLYNPASAEEHGQIATTMQQAV